MGCVTGLGGDSTRQAAPRPTSIGDLPEDRPRLLDGGEQYRRPPIQQLHHCAEGALGYPLGFTRVGGECYLYRDRLG